MKPHIFFRDGRWIAWPRRGGPSLHHLACMFCNQLNWRARNGGEGDGTR